MSEELAVGVAEPLERTVADREEDRASRPGRQPRFNVILWDDEDHSYEYVITMLMELFGYPPEQGFQLAEEVDTAGRAILLTTTREHAELKRDQIHAYGTDVLIDECEGSMWSTIEPAGS
jgi:ATP-dependent Clp protease adaptor protein ClpS